MSLEGNRLSLTGTDLEVELVGRIDVQSEGADGDITVPARKLVDICKAFPTVSIFPLVLKTAKLLCEQDEALHLIHITCCRVSNRGSGRRRDRFRFGAATCPPDD